MFGCSVGDLVGAPVSTIIPAPFNNMHDGFLHSYLQADRPSSFMNRTQHVFASRRNGTIFPVALRVRQISGGLHESVFLAVISEVRVSALEHFLLYEPESNRVKAVSAGCAALLGVDAPSLHHANASVLLDTVLPALKDSKLQQTNSALANAGKPFNVLQSNQQLMICHFGAPKIPQLPQVLLSSSSERRMQSLRWLSRVCSFSPLQFAS